MPQPPLPPVETSPWRFSFLYLFIFAWLAFFIYDFVEVSQRALAIPYSQFLSAVDAGKVSSVEIDSDKITGTYRAPQTITPAANAKPVTVTQFSTFKIADPQLITRLEKHHVKFDAVPQSSFWKDTLSWIVPIFLFMFIFSLLGSRFKNVRADFLSIGKSKARVYVEKDLKTRFADVAGVDEVKAELREVVDFLKNPEVYSKLGGHMPKGVLLVGPPGTGKTLLARATAGEANVPFFSINGSEFVEMFVGIGAARVRDLFEQARTQAPCIIFVDELDALGKARGISAIHGSNNDEKEQTLNQLLAELDGFDSSQGVILLAATNRPEVLDPALLRSGRFDRQIVVDKPDRRAREEILQVHVKNIVLGKEANLEVLASLTAGFSGADLANLVNEAALGATRRGASAVESRDFTMAIERLTAGLERKSRVLNEKDKRRVATHEMGHATVAFASGGGGVVHKVSIIPRGMGALGYTFRRQTDDRYLIEKRELLDQICMLLGGRAAEEIYFSEVSTGAADDLDKATEIARAMITKYGMSDRLGMPTLEKDTNPYLGIPGNHKAFAYSEQTALEIDRELKLLLNDAITRAKTYIVSNKLFVNRCISLLLKQETIEEDQLKKIWDKTKDEADHKAG